MMAHSGEEETAGADMWPDFGPGNFISELDAVREELPKWDGARARVWAYHASHSKLAIHLFMAETGASTWVIAVSCERIAGAFGWDRCQLCLEEAPGHFQLVDMAAGFSLDCRSVFVAREFDPARWWRPLDAGAL